MFWKVKVLSSREAQSTERYLLEQIPISSEDKELENDYVFITRDENHGIIIF